MSHLSLEVVVWCIVFLTSLAAADLVSFYVLKDRKGTSVTLIWWGLALTLLGIVVAAPIDSPYLRLAAFLIAGAKIQNASDVAFKRITRPLRANSFFNFLKWTNSPPDTVIAKSSEGMAANRQLGLQRIKIGLFQLIPGIALVYLNQKFSFQEISFALYFGYVGIAILLLPSGFFRLAIGIYMLASGHYTKPMFDNPMASISIHEFWSKRWNMMYMRSAFRTVFRPMLKQGFSPFAATMTVFICSGITHELLIFVVRGSFDGYNGAFFLLQGLAVNLEKRFWPAYSLQPRALRRAITWLWFAVTGPLFVKAFAEMFSDIL